MRAGDRVYSRLLRSWGLGPWVLHLHAVEPSVEGPRRPRILGVVFSAVASMLRRVEALRGVASLPQG